MLKVSVIIPVKDEEKNISACLDGIFSQSIDADLEVIIIDSGSTDKTLKIIKEYENVELIEISPDEFGHGKTRNLGAKRSSGEYIVFLNADAIPADNKWLSEMLRVFKGDENIGGVYSRHIPKEDCHLYMKRDLYKSMPNYDTVITKTGNLNFMLFSTVSCMIPRSVWEKYSFKDDIAIAEDQEWAKRVLNRGMKVVYKAGSTVYHSHNYTNEELYKIKYKVAKASGKFNSLFSAVIFGFFLSIGGFFYKCSADLFFILFKASSKKNKLKELYIAITARFYSFLGKFKGWIKKK